AGLGVDKEQVPEGRPKPCPTQSSLQDSALSLRCSRRSNAGLLSRSRSGTHSVAQNLICALLVRHRFLQISRNSSATLRSKQCSTRSNSFWLWSEVLR